MLKNHNFLFLIILISSVITVATLFATKDGYAQTVNANQTVAITTNIDPITILTNELIPLLDTSTIGNLTSLSVTANLPCDSSNVPTLKIIAGILDNTTNVIDASSDYTNNKGPRDTCLFTDKITNVTAKGIPAMNRVFLKNTGSTPVHIPEGVMVTLTGLFGKSVVKTTGPDFQDDYTTNTGWTQVGSGVTVNSGVAGKVVAINALGTANNAVYKSLGTTLSDTNWVAEFEYKHSSALTQGVFPIAFTAGTGDIANSNQDALLIHATSGDLVYLYYKDGAGALAQPTGTVGIPVTDNTVYYMKLERTGTTSMKLSVFTDPARTIHQTNSPNTGTNVPATVTGLTHIQHAVYNDGASTRGDFEVDNTKIWNGANHP